MAAIGCGSACASGKSCTRTDCKISPTAPTRLPAPLSPPSRSFATSRATAPPPRGALPAWCTCGCSPRWVPRRYPTGRAPTQQARARSNPHTVQPVVFVCCYLRPSPASTGSAPRPCAVSTPFTTHTSAPSLLLQCASCHTRMSHVQLFAYSSVRRHLARRLVAGAC